MKNLKKVFLLGLVLLGLSSCGSGEEKKVDEASGEVKTEEGGGRLAQIKERGYLTVATEPYFVPYEYIDPSKEGEDQYQGSDIELARYIADDLGVDLKIYPLEFGAVLSSVTEGKYDLAISALAYTPARAETMALSDNYYVEEESGDAGYGLCIRSEDKDKIKGPEDLKDKTIVYQSGSLQEVLADENIKEVKEVKKTSSTNDALLMLQEGKADCTIVALPMSQLYIEANNGCGLENVEGFKFTVDDKYSGTRIGMQKGDEDFMKEINRIIKDLKDSGKYADRYQEYSQKAKDLGIE